MSVPWRVLAVRSAGSVCGAAKRYCSCDSNELEWPTAQGAKAYASHMNKTCTSLNVEYFAEPKDGRNNST